MDPHEHLRQKARQQDLEYRRSLYDGLDTTPPRPSMVNPDPGNRALIKRLQEKQREAEKEIAQCKAREAGQSQRVEVLEDEIKTLKAKVKGLENRQNTTKRPQQACNNKRPEKLTENALNKLSNQFGDGHIQHGKKPEGSLLAEASTTLQHPDGKNQKVPYSAAVERERGEEHLKKMKENGARIDALIQRLRADTAKPPIETPKDKVKESKTQRSSNNLQPEFSSSYESPTGKYGRYEPKSNSHSPRDRKTSRTETINRSPIDQSPRVRFKEPPVTLPNTKHKYDAIRFGSTLPPEPTDSVVAEAGSHMELHQTPIKRSPETLASTKHKCDAIRFGSTPPPERTDTVLAEVGSYIEHDQTPTKATKHHSSTNTINLSTRTPARTDSPRHKHRRTRYRPAEGKKPKVHSRKADAPDDDGHNMGPFQGSVYQREDGAVVFTLPENDPILGKVKYKVYGEPV